MSVGTAIKNARYFVAISLLFVVSTSVSASPEVHALRIDQPPRVDGILDDACWHAAEPLTNFTQVLPVQGAPPTERTEVRFVYTRDVLFIGVRCFDRHPERILVKTMQHDNSFDSDDYVKIAFDPFANGRDGYAFAVNAAGARYDSNFGKFSEEDKNFDAIWWARASVDAEGWAAEIAIPFKSISFDVKKDFWRLNVERVIRHAQETDRWTAISAAKRVTALEDFGDLRDLSGLRQGLGLDFRPYVRTTYRNDSAPRNEGFLFDTGFDVTYRLTPSGPFAPTLPKPKSTNALLTCRVFRHFFLRSVIFFCRMRNCSLLADSKATTASIFRAESGSV